MKWQAGSCCAMLLLFPHLSIAQETGDIQLICEPGVKVYLDGTFKGETSADLGGLILQRIPAGRHKIRVVKEGLQPLEAEFEVSPGKVLKIPIAFKTGQILVRCEPGAKIFLDGLFEGESNSEVGGLLIEHVPTGRHKIRAVKEGSQPQEDEVELAEGKTAVLKLKPFQPKSAAKGGKGAGAGKEAVAGEKRTESPPEEVPSEWKDSLGLRFRIVSGGEFDMELPEGSVGSKADAPKSVRREAFPAGEKIRVRLTRAFWISACEVKESDFEKVMGKKPKNPVKDFRLEQFPGKPLPNLPAMSVSWDEAAEFCRSLSDLPGEKAAGIRYRLPTEAEWVLAKRSADPRFTCFPWSSRNIPMNVWELCSTSFDKASYKDSPQVDPQGPPSGDRRVARLAYGKSEWVLDCSTFRIVAEGPPLKDLEARKRTADLVKKAVLEKAPETDPIRRGLCWLARHQESDGHWSTMTFDSNCGGKLACGGRGSLEHDVGLTGLALLAFLGAGPTSEYAFEDPFQKGKVIFFGEVAGKGLRWLAARQDAEGCFPKMEREFMYDHAIATLALARAARLSGDPNDRDSGGRGIDFLLKAQNPGFAWRYGFRQGENDTSVTGWCVQALNAANLAGLRFDRSSFLGVKEWLKRVTNVQGVVGYQSPGDEGVVIDGLNDKWQAHPAMTAVGLLCRSIADTTSEVSIAKKPVKKSLDVKRSLDPWMRVAVDMMLKDLPAWDVKKKSIDSYYWHYGTLALLAAEGPKGPAWKAFQGSVKEALLPHQEGSPANGPVCQDGSWDPGVDKWGCVAGRVYTTAINLLTLEAAEAR